MASVLRPEGTVAIAVSAILVALALRMASRPDGRPVEVEVGRELAVTSGDARWTVPFYDVRATTVRETFVLFADTAVVIDVLRGPAPRLLVRLESIVDAEALRARIEAARDRANDPGPFRAPARGTGAASP